MSRPRGPVVVDVEPGDAPGPADVPPVEETPGEGAGNAAMQALAMRMSAPPSALGRWFLRVLLAAIVFAAGLWAWDTVEGLIARSRVLGGVALGLGAALALLSLAILVREWAALARLGRLDGLRNRAVAAREAGDLAAARKVLADLCRLYRERPETDWARARLAEREAEILDADALLVMAEAELLRPIDAAAEAEVAAAARQVAAVTAFVPLALADILVALLANLRMIRRIAGLYGGRGGVIGGWRLTRAVMTHLVATGAVAVGDDLIEPLLGGGLATRLSRRFGEGVINGALTARVGVAAIEVCRPLPFAARSRPRAGALVRAALTGLFRKG